MNDELLAVLVCVDAFVTGTLFGAFMAMVLPGPICKPDGTPLGRPMTLLCCLLLAGAWPISLPLLAASVRRIQRKRSTR